MTKTNVRKFAEWLSSIFTPTTQGFPTARSLFRLLADSYEPASKPLSEETLRKICKYALAISGDDGARSIEPPKIKDSTFQKLFKAVCELKSLDTAEQMKIAGVYLSTHTQPIEKTRKKLEPSRAFRLLKHLYVHQIGDASDATDVNILGCACGLEIRPPKSYIPAPRQTRILIVAIANVSDRIGQVLKEHFTKPDSISYSAILVLVDTLESFSQESLNTLMESMGKLQHKGFAPVTLKTTGTFFYELLDPEHASRVLIERFSIATGASSDDEFSLEDDVEETTAYCSMYNEKAGNADQKSQNLLTQIKKIAISDNSSRCMIRGGFGSGKTTALYKMSLDLLRRATDVSRHENPSYEQFLSTPLPIIIPANEILSINNLQEVFADAIREWYETPLPQSPASNRIAENQFLHELIRSGILVVIIDGLDESPTLSRVDQIEQLLRDLPLYYPKQSQMRPGGAKYIDQSKYILSFRPEIFSSDDEENRLLGTTFDIGPNSPVAFIAQQRNLQTLTISERRLLSSDSTRETKAPDDESLELVVSQTLSSLQSSPLFDSMLRSISDQRHSIQLHQAYSHFIQKDSTTNDESFPRLLYETLKSIADRWERREAMRDKKRNPDSEKRTSGAIDRLEDCTEVAIYMLGRPDCRAASYGASGKTQCALSQRHLDEVISRQNYAQFSARDNLSSAADILPSDRQRYDFSVTMMLLKESTATPEHAGNSMWRFPNFAMENFFMARGLYEAFRRLNDTSLSCDNLEDPRARDRYLSALNRSLFDDRLRAAILILVGIIENQERDPHQFLSNPLERLRRSNDSLATMARHNPVLSINIATVSAWGLELIDRGAFGIDFSNLLLPGISIAPWRWGDKASTANPILRIQSGNFEDSQIQYSTDGNPIFDPLTSDVDRFERLCHLVGEDAIFEIANQGHHEKRQWCVVPGGEFLVDKYGPVRERRSTPEVNNRNFQSGSDNVQSVPKGQDGHALGARIYVPSFLIDRNPVSNADFLDYLQKDSQRDGAWPLAERRSTSNPWYLYDWAGIEFLLGSDLKLWPDQTTIDEIRDCFEEESDPSDETVKLILMRLNDSRQISTSGARYADWHKEWFGPKDPIEEYGWFFSEKNPLIADVAKNGAISSFDSLDEEFTAQGRKLLLLISTWSAMPISRVNWRVAQDFVRIRECALPTEAEFEAAARWLEYMPQADAHQNRQQDDYAEFAEGLDHGQLLWSLIWFQLQSYLPALPYDGAAWRRSEKWIRMQDRAKRFITEKALGDNQSMTDVYADKMAMITASLEKNIEGNADLAMPASYLTGVIGTWTRDVYDPTWPLATASKPNTEEQCQFYPLNTGLTYRANANINRNAGITSSLSHIAERPLRTIRGRGLRLGWRRGFKYRFGQAETNVNPDVGIRCVKPLKINR